MKCRSRSQDRRIAEHRKQAAYDRTQANQHDEEFEKLCESPIRTKSVDDPEQNRPDDDGDKNANCERNHDGPALLGRRLQEVGARARSSPESENTYWPRWSTLMTAPKWTKSNAWRPLVGALLAFRPQGVFQIFPQPISISNMHTLAVFKDR